MQLQQLITNATTTTITIMPQSIWNSIVVKFTKDIISSLSSSFTSKVDVAIMDGNSSQILLPTTCQQMKQNADCQLQHVLFILKPLLPMYQLITNDKSIYG